MPKPKSSKKDSSRHSHSKQPQQQPQPTPNWPPLRPLIPSSDLILDPILPDQIYLIRNFLHVSLCKTYVSFLASLPLITTPGRPKKGEAVRVNDRFQIQDARFADILWRETALKELVTKSVTEEEQRLQLKEIWGGEPLGLNANIRVYRYSPGQFFAQHCESTMSPAFSFSFMRDIDRKADSSRSVATWLIADGVDDDSNTLSFSSPSTPSPKPARTTWTLLIYLNTCSGGETIFYPEPTRACRNPEPISVAPEMGMALLHRHGDRCLLHEGSEVTIGEKWVLRSDLVVPR